jgi:hypothetical protein
MNYNNIEPLNDTTCKACGRSYSNVGNLNKHLKLNSVCRNWIDRIDEKAQTHTHESYNAMCKNAKLNSNLNLIQNQYVADECEQDTKPKQYQFMQNTCQKVSLLNFQGTKNKCHSCGKSFSNQSNLNKHIRNSIVCQKWLNSFHQIIGDNLEEIKTKLNPLKTSNSDKYSKYQTIKPKLKLKNKNQDILPYNEVVHDDIEPLNPINTNKMTKFDHPKDKLIHIIWNLYLCDKYQTINEELIHNNKIGYLIGILPRKENLNKYVNSNMHLKTSVIEYFDDHNDNISIEMLKKYDEESQTIEQIRKQEYRNIIIFCNNGYQRSIPFLCYYLMKHHKDEYNSLLKTLNLILGKVQNSNSPELVDDYNNLLPKLCNMFQKSNQLENSNNETLSQHHSSDEEKTIENDNSEWEVISNDEEK